MTNVEQIALQIKLILEAGKITSPKFVSIKNYRNQKGELSNYLFNLGMKYEDQKQKDLEQLTGFDTNGDTLLEQARLELIDAMVKNQSDDTRTAQSQAQIDSYIQIAPNVKMHKETGDLYITGFLVKKEVIEAIEYKAVNSRPLTIAKEKVKKLINSITAKYRSMSFTGITISGSEVRLNGGQVDFSEVEPQ